MFTGLIEEIGTLERISSKDGSKEFAVKASFAQELKIGESVAINGACQSVTRIDGDVFSVFCMSETLKRTNFNLLKAGDKINLERAMLLNSRLDGHIVQGHIDSCAKFLNKKNDGGAWIFEFEFPHKYLIEKGSIAINGISLTISEVKKDSFCVSVIPQTLERTNLRFLKTQDLVNVEIDMFAKYVEKFLSANDNKSRISEDFLKENGF